MSGPLLKLIKRISNIPIAILLSLAFYNNSAIAIPTLGALMPEKGKYLGGGRADLIFDRDVKDYHGAKTTAYYYRASYGFADWFSVDGLVGLGNLRAEYINEKELHYPFNFSGGYGWRAKLYRNERCGMDWVCGFQHVSTHPGVQWYNNRKHEIIWDEWQLSTVVAKRIYIFTPYCGMKWSFTYLISELDDDRHRRLSNGPPIGLVVGADMRLNDYLYLNVESRFFDETALNAGFVVKY